MSPPLRSLVPLLRPAFILLALQCFFLYLLLFSPNPHSESFYFLHVGVTALVAVPYGWRHPWLWRFCRHIRRFKTVEHSRIVLHYEPELEGSFSVSALLQSCQRELDNLTRLFGLLLRKRVSAFFFAHGQEIGAIFGPRYGALAIGEANTIILPKDDWIPETIRHELAHLFSRHWNVIAPPLLSEGLSVYLQETIWGQRIDDAALPLLLQGGPKLSSLLRSKFFFAEPQRPTCYILAGSFTGFLIRRFGWDRYRKLYRRCSPFRFRATFRKCIGITLEAAEWQWRNELMTCRS